MQKYIRWLRNEMDGWVKEGLIHSDQAAQINRRYPESEVLPWATIIFSGLGSLILGLGIILLFAYNWHVIPRLGKFSLILILLLGTHTLALRLFWNSSRFRALGEGLTILGTMLFGGGIWLVAQIYHLNEHYPNAFIAWGMGALLMAWSLPSISQAVLASLLFTIWTGSEGFGYSNPAHLGLVLHLSILIFAWTKRAAFLLGFAILMFLISLSIVFGTHEVSASIWAGCCISFAVLFVAGSRILQYHPVFPKAASVFSSFGWILGTGIIFVYSFPFASSEFSRSYDRSLDLAPFLYLFVFAIGAIVTAFYVVHLIRAKKLNGNLSDILLPLTAVLIVAQVFLPDVFQGWMAAAAYNLTLLALSLSTMANGCLKGSIKYTLFGALLLIAQAFARYTDLFESLLARGAVFLLVGGIIFAEGIYYTRSQRSSEKKTP